MLTNDDIPALDALLDPEVWDQPRRLTHDEFDMACGRDRRWRAPRRDEETDDE